MKTRFSKFLALALALIMVLTALPVSALGNVASDSKSKTSYPKQSFTAELEGGLTVSVSAPKGALPKGTEMKAVRVDNNGNVQAAVDFNRYVDGNVIAAADITFTLGDDVIKPEKPVSVSFKSPEIKASDDIFVAHIKGDAEDLTRGIPALDVVSDYEVKKDVVTFDASDFSIYVIGDGNDEKTITVTFYEPDGQTVINRQRVRVNSIQDIPVYDPGVPSITDTQAFEGWAQGTYFEEGDIRWDVDMINDYIEEHKSEFDEGDELKFTAMVFNVAFITYHDQNGAIIKLESAHLKNGTASYTVSFPYNPTTTGFGFVDWVDAIDSLGQNPTYPANANHYPNGTTITVTGNLDLYPFIRTGNWLIFDNNIDKSVDDTRASFTEPSFVPEGEASFANYGKDSNGNTLTIPQRPGYVFGGWYTDAACTVGHEFTIGSPIDNLVDENGKLTVYAKWNPGTASWRVVIWQQENTDEVNLADEDKSWAYYQPTTISTLEFTGTTGTNATIASNSNFLRLGKITSTTYGEMTGYFTVNDNLTETSKRIKGDGSTVLNVYYDRATITITFWTDSNKDTPWNGGNVSYVLAENGDYYYYDQPYPSGYYFIGTGPNASYQPTAGDTVYYPGYMSSASMPSTTYYSASTSMYSHTISSSYTYVGITSGDDYWFIREYDSGYYYYPLFYSYSPAYSTGYYAVGTGPNPTAPGTHNQTGFTNPMVGLYQHPLPNWPVTPGVSGYYWKYYDPEDTSSTTHIFGITVRDAYSIPDNFYTTTWDIYAEATSHSSFKTIHWMIEKLDGTFEEKTTSQWGNNTSKQYYDHKKFYGFNAYGHNLSSNSTTSSFVRFDPDVHCAEWSDIPSSSSNVYFYFIRRTYSFIYMSNNEPVETKTNVKYGANISSFANKTLEDHDGYYFDGWYADPGFKTRYDFNTTMPDNNVVVFAKWVPMRFRVVLDPTGGDSTADVHFGSSQQATAFRLDYGELIGSSGLNAITREGYTLLGWYYDQAGQHPFSFETGITDTIRNMDMTYGDDLTSSRRQGVDIYNNNAEWYDNDGLHDDVRGYLKLYALWSKNAVGGSGVRVRYDAIQGEGHFGVDPNTYIIRDDPNIYADQAKAYAQAASTPDDAENRQFLYWVVMRPDEDGNLVPTNIKVYPGQTFTVDMAY
ncbi:MAG: InlB B-repeat-containing protein, partial [Clostridia bacterium]|nr:InlB B-repeat-containing protein [Clostridia bacterium]